MKTTLVWNILRLQTLILTLSPTLFRVSVNPQWHNKRHLLSWPLDRGDPAVRKQTSRRVYFAADPLLPSKSTCGPGRSFNYSKHACIFCIETHLFESISTRRREKFGNCVDFAKKKARPSLCGNTLTAPACNMIQVPIKSLTSIFPTSSFSLLSISTSVATTAIAQPSPRGRPFSAFPSLLVSTSFGPVHLRRMHTSRRQRERHR